MNPTTQVEHEAWERADAHPGQELARPRGERARLALKRTILWSYERGSWQYDLICLVILAFIFLTPRAWFRDQPRIPNPQQIVMLPSETGRPVFWIDPELVGETPPEALDSKIRVLLQKRTGKSLTVLKVESAKDDEGNLKGYFVRARF